MEHSRTREWLTGLNSLGKVVLAINQNNGWNCTVPADWSDTYKIPAILALVGTEVSEAVEAFRHDDKDNFAEELADVVIRVLDCAAGLEIDLESAIAAKLTRNTERGYRHGGKRV